MSDTVNTKIQPDDLGTVHIAEEVIASIASLAAAEVEGVGGLSMGGGVELSDLLGKKHMAKGVKIAVENNAVTCDVYLLVKRTHPILKVSQAVQENVKTHIESMTGLDTPIVNVHVVGIAFEKVAKKGKSAQ